MQAYFEPEQAFSISMPQPVFELSIAYKKKHVHNAGMRFPRPLFIILYFYYLQSKLKTIRNNGD